MERIYAAVGDRLLAVDDGGMATLLSGPDLQGVAAAGDALVVATFGSGVYRGTDHGSTVEHAWPADAADAVTSVALSPADPDLAWAGTEPSAVYRSSDGGATWTHRPGLTDLPRAGEWSFPPRPETHHVRWLEPDPRDPERLYVGVEAGALVRTTDGGDTWEDLTGRSRRDPHGMATHDGAPGRICVAAGDGYAESEDGGDTWRYPQEGLDHRYVWSVALAPGDHRRVFVSAASGPYRAHDPEGESYVYVRRGDGEWERATDGLPGPEGAARPVLASGPDHVYALSNHGLFRRAEGGWQSVLEEWPEGVREQLPRGVAVV